MRKEPQPTADSRRRAADHREQPPTSANRRQLQADQVGATSEGMAGDELITFAEAGRRLPKPNGAPRSERTMQDWGQRGLLVVEAFSAHRKLVNWTATLRQRARGGKVLPSDGAGSDARATDTSEEPT
jgi:hypothetical protein